MRTPSSPPARRRLGRRQFDHRRAAGRGVDRRPQRHAVDGVEGELGAAEQAAAFAWARRAPCRPAGRRRRWASRRRRRRGLLSLEIASSILRDRRDFVAVRGRARCARFVCGRRRVAVERVRGGVVERHGVSVGEDLVSPFSDCSSRRTRPSLAIHSRPDAPVTSGLEVVRRPAPPPLARLAPSSRWSVKLDVRAHAFHRGARRARRGSPRPAAWAVALGPSPARTRAPWPRRRRAITQRRAAAGADSGRRRRMFTAGVQLLGVAWH